MSHAVGKAPVICPNCGHPATLNYCAQCGQETHLHKDTFWGLIMHFAGHYFHYDSKFWKTLKALWFAPGKLTKEYWEGKRARAIPPISLYIFVSAVFFIVTALGVSMERKRLAASGTPHMELPHSAAPQAQAPHRAADTLRRIKKHAFLRRASDKLSRLETESDEATAHFLEEFLHQMPKIFFFMIPVMAATLKLLFLRRKGAHFAHHAIFSLHLHAYFFSLFLITLLNPFESIEDALNGIALAVYAVYFVLAMRRAYAIGYGRAIAATLFIGLGYAVFFLAALLYVILYIVQ